MRIAQAAAVFVMLTSCVANSYEYVQYEVLRPADYTLPADVERVALVCTAPVKETANVYIALNDNKLATIPKGVDTIGIFAIRTIANILNSSGYISATCDTTRGDFDYIVRNSLKICAANNAQGIIVLQNIDNNAEINLEKIYLGSFESTLLSGTFVGNSHLELTFVRPGGIYKNFEPRNDTLIWNAEAETVELCIRELPEYDEVELACAENSAQKFAMQIVPSWERISRAIFANNNADFGNAHEWLRRNEWSEAQNIWGEIYNGRNVRNSARAAYNLAISFDCKGDITQAIAWCNNSIEKYNALKNSDIKEKAAAEKLFEEMLARQKEIELLDKQMIR